jgi:hypothetical protein
MYINNQRDPFRTYGPRPKESSPRKEDVTAVCFPDDLAEVLRWKQLVTACRRTDGIVSLSIRGCAEDIDPFSPSGPLWRLDEATLLPAQQLSAAYGTPCDRDGITVAAALAWNHFADPDRPGIEDLLSLLGESLFTTVGNPGGAWLPLAANLDREGIRRTLDFLVGQKGERAKEPVPGSTSWDVLSRTDGISLLAWAYRGTLHRHSTLARKKELPVFVMHRFDPAVFVNPCEKALDFLEILTHHPSFPKIMDCKVSREVQGDSFLDTLDPPQPLFNPVRRFMGYLAEKIADRIGTDSGTQGRPADLRDRLVALYRRMIVHCPEFTDDLIYFSQPSPGSEKWEQITERLGFGGTEGFLAWIDEVRVRGRMTEAVTPAPDETFQEPLL